MLLAGCAGTGNQAGRTTLEPASVETAAFGPPEGARPEHPQAERLRAAFNALERRMQAAGAMRQEIAPADAPYSNQELLRNFLTIALYAEHISDGRSIVSSGGPTVVRRWGQPIRYRLVGDGVRPSDETAVQELAARLSKATGLEIGPAPDPESTNMLITILTFEERTGLSYMIASQPGETPFFFHWMNEPLWPCAGSFGGDGGGGIQAAHVFIKDEVGEGLRMACLAEEIAQSLGLTNDSYTARPTLFNDRKEFAVLTEHDEILLRILYDPRLSPGMDLNAAAPIAAQVISELRPEGGSMHIAEALLAADRDAAIPVALTELMRRLSN